MHRTQITFLFLFLFLLFLFHTFSFSTSQPSGPVYPPTDSETETPSSAGGDTDTDSSTDSDSGGGSRRFDTVLIFGDPDDDESVVSSFEPGWRSGSCSTGLQLSNAGSRSSGSFGLFGGLNNHFEERISFVVKKKKGKKIKVRRKREELVENVSNDLWTCSVDSEGQQVQWKLWKLSNEGNLPSPPPPPPRTFHSCWSWSVSESSDSEFEQIMIIFGGGRSKKPLDGVFNDFWSFQFLKKTKKSEGEEEEEEEAIAIATRMTNVASSSSASVPQEEGEEDDLNQRSAFPATNLGTSTLGGRMYVQMAQMHTEPSVIIFGGLGISSTFSRDPEPLCDVWKVSKIGNTAMRSELLFGPVHTGVKRGLSFVGGRYGASSWISPTDETLHVFGGYSQCGMDQITLTNDLWSLDLKSNAPRGRWTHVGGELMCGGFLDEEEEKRRKSDFLYAFGGRPKDDKPWPASRYGSMTWVWDDMVFMLGGSKKAGYFNDLWYGNGKGYAEVKPFGEELTGFEVEDRLWLDRRGLAAVAQLPAVPDQKEHVVFVYSGVGGGNDLWRFRFVIVDEEDEVNAHAQEAMTEPVCDAENMDCDQEEGQENIVKEDVADPPLVPHGSD